MAGLSGKKICVYCGARDGRSPGYRRAATELGAVLAREGVTLVYGGGGAGLMGAVCDAVLDAGGEAIGVIPAFLSDREMAHRGVQTLEVVEDMHTRKARMIALADAIIALPGGLGTFEELFEAMTWRQLGLHTLPVGVIDPEGYYSDVFSVLESTVDAGFAELEVLNQLKRFESADDLIGQWQAGTWT